MSQPPTPYSRQYNFTNFQTTNPTTPLPGQKVDQELNAVLTTLNAAVSRLGEVQADDGKVRNSALNLTTIAQSVEPLLTAGPLTSINAAGNNQIVAINTSGTTQVSAVNAAGSTQLAALNAVINSANAISAQNAATEAWYSAYQADSWQQYAATYRDQALAHKNAAAQSAADASLYRGNALAYSNAASSARIAAEGYAGQAALEASASNIASLDAEASKMYALDAKAQAEAAAASANASEISASASATQAEAAASSFSLSIGQVYSGSFPAAVITGTAPNYVLDLTLQAGSIGPAGQEGPPGQTGATGATGATGPAGPGVAPNGSTGQALVKASNASYDTAWATIQTGDKYLTTSTTSLTIDNNNKTLTVGAGLAYTTQQDIVIAYDASNHMHCLVTSYNPTTGVLVVDVQTHTGSGTYSSWTVNVGGTTTAVLPSGGTTSQILQKASNADFDVSWTTPYTGANALKTANNLSELTATASTARANLGLGTMATETASSYALLSSPTFSGSPSLPTGTIGVTQSAGTNNNTLATTAFVTVADSLKANIASPTFTGVPAAPTAPTSTNSTQVATTAFVKNQNYATVTFTQSQYYQSTNPAGYITSSALAGYATESYVTSQGYLTDAPNDGNEYVRKNAAWAVATGGGGGGGGGSVSWGGISGTVTNQTDLVTYISGLGYQTANDVSVYATSNFYPLGTNPGGYLVDAPSDGNQYARQNGGWYQVSGGGGGSTTWGSISGTVTAQSDLVAYVDGAIAPTVNDVSTTIPYTLALTDANNTVMVENINYSNVIIVPDDASVNFPVGTVINVALFNCQYVSFLSSNYGSAPLVNSSNQSNGPFGVSSPYQLLRLIKLAADKWILA